MRLLDLVSGLGRVHHVELVSLLRGETGAVRIGFPRTPRSPLAAASISPADLERQNLVVYVADDSVLDRLGGWGGSSGRASAG